MYAQYDYLQVLADNWMGIVVNNYEAIMPIPFRKKWGILYCYNAPFVQQSGLFGNEDEELLKKLMRIAKKHFSYGDLFFNFQNRITNVLANVRTAENYV
ncbi:MAG: hypothetical protein M3R72_10095, partial [Bacteroidota bacterium]|nr:hypothetical protein [Bacteroidota bacterium]